MDLFDLTKVSILSQYDKTM